MYLVDFLCWSVYLKKMIITPGTQTDTMNNTNYGHLHVTAGSVSLLTYGHVWLTAERKTKWPLTGISARSSSFVSLVFFTTSIPFAFNTSTHLGSTSSLIKTFRNEITILNGPLLRTRERERVWLYIRLRWASEEKDIVLWVDRVL